MKQYIGSKNLKHMNGHEILVYSKGLSGKTNAEIAAAMHLGEETVARYLRAPREGEPTYGLPIERVESWNHANGNTVVNDWIDQRSGGVFTRISGTDPKKADVAERIESVHKESMEAIQALIADLQDGNYSPDGLESMEKELLDVRREVDDAILSVRGRMTLV